MAKKTTTSAKDDAGGPAPVTAPAPPPVVAPGPVTRLGQVVSVLLRSPMYRHLTIGDLEWLVIPAIRAGQFSILEAQSAVDRPLGVALWATVSPVVDRRLTAQKAAGLVPFRLAPSDWRSGDILWLMDLIALRQARQNFLDRLNDTAFKGRTVKYYFERSTKPVAPKASTIA